MRFPTMARGGLHRPIVLLIGNFGDIAECGRWPSRIDICGSLG